MSASASLRPHQLAAYRHQHLTVLWSDSSKPCSGEAGRKRLLEEPMKRMVTRRGNNAEAVASTAAACGSNASEW